MPRSSDTEPIVFKAERSDILVQARFQDHLWSLFHNIPVLYTALLDRLAEFGLTPRDLRSDIGDSSLGGYNVNFWLFGVRALVRIRIDSVEVDFKGINDNDVESFERAFVLLLQALRDADDRLHVTTYTVDLRLHGSLEEVDTVAFLAKFVPSPPESSGPYLGAGAVFYYGEDEATTQRTLTVDLSGALAGRLYIRIYCSYKDQLGPASLRAAVSEHLTTTLRSLGLAQP